MKYSDIKDKKIVFSSSWGYDDHVVFETLEELWRFYSSELKQKAVQETLTWADIGRLWSSLVVFGGLR